MPLATLRRPGFRWLPAAAVLCVLALAGGWWLGSRPGWGPRREDPRQVELSARAADLRAKLERQEASPAERQRLLELLVGLGRQDEAIALLEPMADREPDRWSLRLMLAELRRGRNDRDGAARELRQILSRHPNQVEALQLLSLIQLEQDRGDEAEATVRKAYEALTRPETRPQGLPVGLLLAEIRERRGNIEQAAATYRELAAAFPTDQRPLLALALLRHGAEDRNGAMEALNEARQRSKDPGKPDPLLDAIAASWGMEPLRAPKAKDPETRKPEPEAPNPPRTP
jgi:tetratricopeptide (TPR) repeat protein